MELRFIRRNYGIPTAWGDMGPRFALLNSKTAEATVREGAASPAGSWRDERGTYVNLSISRFVQTNDALALCRTPDWYLWPVDWSNVIERVQLPPELSIETNSTVLFETRTDILWTAQLPQEVDGKPYFICIQMFPDRLTPSSDSRQAHMWVMESGDLTGEEQHAKWAPVIRYPLYIPAIAFDVVTFPIQIVHDYFMFLTYMSGLGP